jgi:hypothetical protein
MPRIRSASLCLTTTTLIAVLATAVSASAAQRFASPTGTGSCAQASPCSLAAAIGSAGLHDEIIVEPGTYTSGEIGGGGDDLDIHGQAGLPRPVIDIAVTAGTTALQLGSEDNLQLSDIDLEVTGGSMASFAMDVRGTATIDDVIVSTAQGGAVAVTGGGAAGVIRDSVLQTANGSALAVFGASMNVRNVTATGTRGLDVESQSGATTVDALNSIFEGQAADVYDNAITNPLNLTLDYDYYSAMVNNGAPPTLTIGDHNIDALPTFAATGDYHETLDSPTVDAGTADALDGAVDPDGDARLLGAAPDIGADEFLSPSVVTGVPTNDSPTSELVTAAVDPHGTPASWRFDYGLTAAYGTSTTPVAISGIGAQAVSAELTGLTNGATYHVRAVAIDAVGRVILGADTTFLVPVPPAPPGPLCACPALIVAPPVLSALHQTHATWRLGTKRASIAKTRPPVGTTFSFTLSRAAKVTVAFIHTETGRRVGGHCVARTKRNASAHSCTRTVPVGSFSVSAKTGANHLTFDGRLSARTKLTPGRYVATFTPAGAAPTPKPHTLAFIVASSK